MEAILFIMSALYILLTNVSAIYNVLEPASVAQLDARPTGYQDVVGSIRPGRQYSFMEI